MGRFTAYDQNGRMVADFDKSAYDFLRMYGRTPEEVMDENAKLRKLASEMRWCLNDKCRWCQKFGTSCSTERDRQELGIEVPL